MSLFEGTVSIRSREAYIVTPIAIRNTLPVRPWSKLMVRRYNQTLGLSYGC